MNNGSDNHKKFQLGPFLSLAGSVASLAALVNVFIDKASTSTNRPLAKVR